MKKNIVTAVILMSICIVCSLLIAGINSFTSKIITENQALKEEKLCGEIFSDFSKTVSVKESGFKSESVLKEVVCANSNGDVIGTIYTVSGKNSYGGITLLVGIDSSNKLKGVQFMENGQSFNTETENHVNSSYVEGLTDTNGINVSCGATYGAKLVKELVDAAFNEGGNK